VKFLLETDVVLESRRSEDRINFKTHATGDNMVRRQQLGTVQFAAGVFSARRP
jgi:hypothetical protein